ncbi:MAG: hypothetical protein WAR21_05350 [Candidatus Acidiferrales bacterium]
MNRTEQTMLRAAMDFCHADADVQRAKNQWRELYNFHDPEIGVCCLPIKNQFGKITRRELPRSKWCEHCKRIVAEAVDYHYALWERRAAKVRMKRAYKKLTGLAGDGGDTKLIQEAHCLSDTRTVSA